MPAADLPQYGGFQLPESLLSLAGEDLGDAASGGAFEHRIGIHKSVAQGVGQGAACGALAGAHHAHQIEIEPLEPTGQRRVGGDGHGGSGGGAEPVSRMKILLIRLMTVSATILPVQPRAHGAGRPCLITRRARFSASHRYWLPELSAAENEARFGPCSLAPGHGHNYELIVAMGGPLDADGMVLNLSEVKHAIRAEVTAQLDFRYLNDTWPEFDLSCPQAMLPTTEALCRAIWTRLAPHLPLVGLRLHEQTDLWVDLLPAPEHSATSTYASPAPMEAFLSIRTHFAAAHRLARPELTQAENEAIYGKCARPNGHGHNYLLDVTVRGAIEPRTGMVCDLAALQRLVEDLVVEPFDHTFLNKDVEHFASTVPTAENIALHIADLLNGPIAGLGARLHKVRLQESPNNAAEVFAEVPRLEMVPAALEALVAG
jgi:6-pyruvoyltetrahydropterin/6-carboxytetrahydropterin synthase